MDFVFDGVSAFHSFGFLLMSAVFTLIGGGIIGYYLYWMFKAKTVKGHISGVMVSGKGHKSKKQSDNGESYYPVYSFRAPNGEMIEQVSSAGNNSLFGKIPGESVILKVLPYPPYRAKKFSLGFLVLGLVFLAPGLYIGSLAIKDLEFNFFTLLIPLGFAGIIAFKISKFISNIPLEERKKGMKFLKAQMSGKGMPEDYKFKITSSDNSGPKRLLDNDEIKMRLKSQAKAQRIVGYITILIAIGTCVGAYFAGEHMQKYMNEGVSIKGEVVDIESRYDSSSEGSGYTYYAVVEFADHEGHPVRFRDSVGASTPMHKRGDIVDVIYLPDNPQKAIIDRGIMNWALSGGLWAVSVFMLYLTFSSFRWTNKYGERGMRYKKRV
ncbi:MAG: DUF3592 domain-containing protein [Alphaproteobacteria bacterium]|nr:DUF3592 domain-containing protein [Alphaproteobacteria bacterium]